MVNRLQKRNNTTPCLAATPSDVCPTILIFDSGVGGLSVYDKIRHLLPDLHYIYVFDNIAFPYGEKSEIFIIKRVVEIISTIQKSYPLTLLVIACNTASIVSLPILRAKFQLPVVGVVPAIKAATRLTTNGIIGLLATHVTIKHSYTRGLINHFEKKYQMMMLGSTELVEIAEAKLQGETVWLNELQHILEPWLRIPEPPDTIILGCTHFSLLQDELLQILPKKTKLIDSNTAVARRTAWLMKHEVLDLKRSDSNIAFCMAITKKTERLLSILHHYGFARLEKLLL